MEWMNDYTPLIYMDMITYPGPDAGAGLVILCQQKGAPDVRCCHKSELFYLSICIGMRWVVGTGLQ